MNELQNSIINDSIIKILNMKQIESEEVKEEVKIIDNSKEEIEELKFRNKILTVALIGVTFMALLV
ncbi:hypothetical protein [uncultured Parvimonas sp.]|uniref:hypothetical protein n=1 Tax=uncultured Parvimonas sp. TaxID=747372 RepID=UPI00325FC025